MSKPYKSWFLQACYDLSDARLLMENGRYNTACFLAQQAAEKAFKAFLLFSGADEVWGHSLFELCRDAVSFDSDFKKICPEVSLLDKYYIPTRYPDALPGSIPAKAFGRQDAEIALKIAREAVEFIGRKLGEFCP